MVGSRYDQQTGDGADPAQGHHSARTRGSSPTGRNERKNAFPLQLHYVLSELENDGFSHIFSWVPHGRAIKVHDKFRFVEEILPNWFRQSKIESFQRQLNMYGFKRITSGRDKNAYYHQLFLRGYPGLTDKMTRFKIKGTGPRKAACPEIEPDLWMLPPLPGLPLERGTTSRSPQDAAHISSQGLKDIRAATVPSSHGIPIPWRDVHPMAQAVPSQVIHAPSLQLYPMDAFGPTSCTTHELAVASLPAPTSFGFSGRPTATALSHPMFLSYMLGIHPGPSLNMGTVVAHVPPDLAIVGHSTRPLDTRPLIHDSRGKNQRRRTPSATCTALNAGGQSRADVTKHLNRSWQGADCSSRDTIEWCN